MYLKEENEWEPGRDTVRSKDIEGITDRRSGNAGRITPELQKELYKI